MRLAAFCIAVFCLATPGFAQDAQELAQMRLYVQQLEERIRLLTGQNEQLAYQLNQLQAQLGQGAAAGAQTGPVGAAAQPVTQPATQGALIPPAQDIGSLSVAQDDPLIAPDGVDPNAPVDLSQLAAGALGPEYGQGGSGQNGQLTPPPQPGQPAGTDVAAMAPPAAGAALSGGAEDEYNLAYGYILTGDYGLAEQSFQNWLAAFPDDPQATDARFWLGESHYQQGEYREAANSFLAVYKAAPDSPKGPDALLKLGVALSALGEKNAACATLAEVGRKYPQASSALLAKVNDEEERAGC